MIDALTMIETGLEVLVVVVLADFVSGFVHWAEDSWGSPSTPFIGKSVIEPNLRHHARPRALRRARGEREPVPQVDAPCAA